MWHYAAGTDGPYYRLQMELTASPEALAAWGDRVWLVFPIDSKSEIPRREVFTLRVEREPATGWYYPSPRDRLEVVEPLPGLGKLVGFLGTADGPVALLWPSQFAGTDVQAGEGSIAAQRTLDGPRLMQLRSGHWRELDLPPMVESGQLAGLATGGETSADLRLLTDLAGEPSQTVVYLRNPLDESWQSSRIPLDMKRFRSAHAVGDRPVLLLEGEEDAGEFEIALLRRESLLPLTRLKAPAGTWALLGLRDGLRILEWHGAGTGTYSIRRIDPVTGEIGERQVLRTPPTPTGSVLHMLVLLVGLAAALALVFVARPAVRQARSLGQGLVPLPLGSRLIALATDVAPGALLAVLITDCAPAELLKWPLWTASLADGVPFLIMAAITISHVTVIELAKGTTMGKSLVGGKVVAIDGSRAGVRQVLLRNLIKCLVIVVPPLAFFLVLNPNLQGLGDLVSQTVVVRADGGEEQSTPADDAEDR
ncbi:MAG: RDD family protein [Phycisphaerales bacterium]|nr:MAG: RDD family protein [Phycisphaerales bacterium]